jgi:DtxR family Mn-dependent transcriptional regulator
LGDDAAPSARTEEYLRAILHLRAQHDRVSLRALASWLDVAPPTAHEMLSRLQDAGLVGYARATGVRLTDEGSRRAFGKERRHHLSRRFLQDVLGMEPDAAIREAKRFEKAMTPIVERQIIRLFQDRALAGTARDLE